MRPHSPPKRPGQIRAPKSTQNRILAKKIAGKSNRQIGREEQMDHKTVGKILRQSGYDQICEQIKKESVELLPDCVRVCRRELQRRGPERIRVALDFLHGHQILVNREQRTVKTLVEKFAAYTDEELNQFIASHLAGVPAS